MIFDPGRINAGIDSYNEIMRQVNTTQFCNADFRTLYNGFYRLRQKPQTWYDAYYDIFLDCKTNPKTFIEVVTELYERTGEIHPSFCSKIVATINPNKPIWDQYVLHWLGIVLNDPKDKHERITYYATIYQQIESEYNEHLNDRNVIEAFAEFDRLVPAGINITAIKKLDFMLWSNRSDRTVSVLDYNKLIDEIAELRTKE